MRIRSLITSLASVAGIVSIFFVAYTIRMNSRRAVHSMSQNNDGAVSEISTGPSNTDRNDKHENEKPKGPIYFPKQTNHFSCKLSNLQTLTDVETKKHIPKIVHWIYVTPHVPEQYKKFMEHCQKINPDHDFVFWTDASAVEFIEKHYPSYLYLFKKAFKDLEFTDALRYFILLHFGGVYLDLDVECRIPFSKGLEPYSCIIDREREAQTRLYWGNEFSAMNSVMACKRNHPFFEQAIKTLKISEKKEKGVLARTGPVFLTTHFLRYNKSDLAQSNPVILAPSTLFSPLMDVNHIPMFQQICRGKLRNDWQRNGCEEFKKNGYSHGDVAKLTKSSVTIHHYLHLGWGSWKSHIRLRVDACKFSNVVLFKNVATKVTIA